MEVRRQEVLLRFSCHTMAVQLRRVAAQPLAEAMHRQLEDTWHIHFQGMSQDDCETMRFHRLFTGLHYHYGPVSGCGCMQHTQQRCRTTWKSHFTQYDSMDLMDSSFFSLSYSMDFFRCFFGTLLVQPQNYNMPSIRHRLNRACNNSGFFLRRTPMRPEMKLKLEETKTIGLWYLYPSELRHGGMELLLSSCSLEIKNQTLMR